MRLVLALARAQSLLVATGLMVALVLIDGLVGTGSLPVPFLEDAVRTGRLFPALLASAGALVVAADWRAFERTAARSPWSLSVVRVVLGAVVALGGAVAVGQVVPLPVVGVTVAAYGLLALLAQVFPRSWWWAVPVLLYAQLFLPSDLLPG